MSTSSMFKLGHPCMFGSSLMRVAGPQELVSCSSASQDPRIITAGHSDRDRPSSTVAVQCAQRWPQQIYCPSLTHCIGVGITAELFLQAAALKGQGACLCAERLLTWRAAA